MTKFLETFFRYKLLLLLPPLLITAGVTSWTLITSPVIYDSMAGIWVDRPTYLASSSPDGNPYASPAQNQSVRINELLHTQSFLNDIARRTVLAPLLSTTRGQDRVAALISNGLIVSGSGHLLFIRMRTENPQLSYEVLTAVVSAFKDNVAGDRISQASLATSFYESRLATATDELGQATNEVRQYLAANPRAGVLTLDPTRALSPALSRVDVDPQLTDIQRRIEAKQSEIDSLRRSLEQARLDASASLEGQELGFQVIDAPIVPAQGGRDLKKRIILPAGALFGSFALSGVLLVLLSITDRTVRGVMDLSTAVRVIGEIPDLRVKGLQRRLGSVATRRAIGLVAGAALPVPSGAK
jgi:uncharacterized protein involved in exopolysaccharide biosynthesis